MIEWKQLPRSIRYETAEYAFDVWQSEPLLYRYSVYDRKTESYVASGSAYSQDEACERALAIGNN